MARPRKTAILGAAAAVATALLFALAGVTGSPAAATGGVSPSPSHPVTPSPSVPPTTPPAAEGCTPGYWKTHPEAWGAVSPDATVGSVFTGAGSFAGTTLLDALSLQGGPGVSGATGILLRAAVAAYLNSQSVDYAYTTAEVVSMVNAALASGDRATILAVAAQLDAANNAGCPLN